MVEVELSRIIVDEDKQEQVIVLKEKKGKRFFPIVIGINEAVVIKMELSRFVSPRPLTHDLIVSIIDNMGFALEKVVIDDLLDNTFHAKLYLKNADNTVKIIDARPSDSIAIALKTKSPIFVEELILEKLAK